MEFENLLKLIDKVSQSKLTEFKMEEEGLKLSLKCEKEQVVVMESQGVSQAVISPQPQQVSPEQSEDVVPALTGNVIKAPLVGTFYNSSSPENPPFVQVGDTVKKGQTLGIIEAMKLMNEIECEFDGVVTAILVENQDMVEYGQPLFQIQ